MGAKTTMLAICSRGGRHVDMFERGTICRYVREGDDMSWSGEAEHVSQKFNLGLVASASGDDLYVACLVFTGVASGKVRIKVSVLDQTGHRTHSNGPVAAPQPRLTGPVLPWIRPERRKLLFWPLDLSASFRYPTHPLHGTHTA